MIYKKRINDILLLSFRNENSQHIATIPYLENKIEKVYSLIGDSFLQGVYTIETNETNETKYKNLIITNLFTNIEYRGQKYASQLLGRAIYEARRSKCKYIKLTDCSEFFMHSQNIYITYGFTYDVKGSPEMTLVL
jgi:predicted GNAT family N-acyltransferase